MVQSWNCQFFPFGKYRSSIKIIHQVIQHTLKLELRKYYFLYKIVFSRISKSVCPQPILWCILQNSHNIVTLIFFFNIKTDSCTYTNLYRTRNRHHKNDFLDKIHPRSFQTNNFLFPRWKNFSMIVHTNLRIRNYCQWRITNIAVFKRKQFTVDTILWKANTARNSSPTNWQRLPKIVA